MARLCVIAMARSGRAHGAQIRRAVPLFRFPFFAFQPSLNPPAANGVGGSDGAPEQSVAGPHGIPLSGPRLFWDQELRRNAPLRPPA